MREGDDRRRLLVCALVVGDAPCDEKSQGGDEKGLTTLTIV